MERIVMFLATALYWLNRIAFLSSAALTLVLLALLFLPSRDSDRHAAEGAGYVVIMVAFFASVAAVTWLSQLAWRKNWPFKSLYQTIPLVIAGVFFFRAQ